MSIVMPTYRKGPEIEQGPIRLKNALRQASEEMSRLGQRKPEIEAVLEPAERLRIDLDFWRHQGDSLAIFLAPDVARWFRLPTSPDEMVVVSHRFHLSPLVPALARGRFLLLAISRHSVRLFEGTRAGVSPVELDVPESVEDANWFADREERLQHHSTLRGGADTFHAHDPERYEDDDLRRFLSVVAEAVAGVARRTSAPVMLAAVDELADDYRKLADHDTFDEHIPGNPDELGQTELYAAAAEILAHRWEELHEEAGARLATAIGERRAATGLADVLQAAHTGRVAEVMAQRRSHVWGRWDEEMMESEIHEERQSGDEDLVDLAVIATLRHGGEAWLLDSLPDGGPVAGVLRY